MSEKAYEDIRAERARQIAKGRDAAIDDARTRSDWIDCLCKVLAKDIDRRAIWVKVGSIAVAAIQSIDRHSSNLEVKAGAAQRVREAQADPTPHVTACMVSRPLSIEAIRKVVPPDVYKTYAPGTDYCAPCKGWHEPPVCEGGYGN